MSRTAPRAIRPTQGTAVPGPEADGPFAGPRRTRGPRRPGGRAPSGRARTGGRGRPRPRFPAAPRAPARPVRTPRTRRRRTETMNDRTGHRPPTGRNTGPSEGPEGAITDGRADPRAVGPTRRGRHRRPPSPVPSSPYRTGTHARPVRTPRTQRRRTETMNDRTGHRPPTGRNTGPSEGPEGAITDSRADPRPRADPTRSPSAPAVPGAVLPIPHGGRTPGRSGPRGRAQEERAPRRRRADGTTGTVQGRGGPECPRAQTGAGRMSRTGGAVVAREKRSSRARASWRSPGVSSRSAQERAWRRTRSW